MQRIEVKLLDFAFCFVRKEIFGDFYFCGAMLDEESSLLAFWLRGTVISLE